jgi:hypothetical protein
MVIENKMMQLQKNASPFSASLRMGYLYDTRVGATSSDITGISAANNHGDSAVATTLNAGYQMPSEDEFGLRFDYGGYADLHQDYREFDMIDQSVSVEPQYTSGNLIYSLPLAYNYVLQDNKSDYYRYVASPTATYVLPFPNQAIAVNAMAAKIIDIDNIKELNEDGVTIGAGCAYLIFFEQSSRIRLSLDYQHTEYDAKLVDYAMGSVSQSHREDNILSANLDLQYNFTSHAGLFTSYTYAHSNSNIDVYEYDRSIIEGGIALRY